MDQRLQAITNYLAKRSRKTKKKREIELGNNDTKETVELSPEERLGVPVTAHMSQLSGLTDREVLEAIFNQVRIRSSEVQTLLSVVSGTKDDISELRAVVRDHEKRISNLER